MRSQFLACFSRAIIAPVTDQINWVAHSFTGTTHICPKLESPTTWALSKICLHSRSRQCHRLLKYDHNCNCDFPTCTPPGARIWGRIENNPLAIQLLADLNIKIICALQDVLSSSSSLAWPRVFCIQKKIGLRSYLVIWSSNVTFFFSCSWKIDQRVARTL